jgi:23S rRNA A2030 N6-methylase RlmJ
MNGSGLLLLHPPYQLEVGLQRTLSALGAALAPDAPPPRVDVLRAG